MKTRILFSVVIASIWISWLILLTHADKIMDNFDSSFQKSGAFGDSFGGIAALMATIAAIGAYWTYQAQNEAIKLERFEHNFFSLLTILESIVKQANVQIIQNTEQNSDPIYKYGPLHEIVSTKTIQRYEAREALGIIKLAIREKLPPDSFSDIKIVSRAYNDTFNNYLGNLGHYFRSVYHILNLVHTRCPGDKKYYARLLRANLSDTEQRLIAYNCIVGKGRGKFAKLVTDYSLLHNLHREGLDDRAQAELNFFVRKLPENAFRFEYEPEITYDD